MGPALVLQDRARPEQSLGLIQGPKGVPPRIGLTTRGQPDAEVRPKDPQVQEIGPEPPREFRVQPSAQLRRIRPRASQVARRWRSRARRAPVAARSVP